MESDPVSPDQAVYYIGTSGWTYDHWKDRFYPEGLSRKAWFDYYASQFNAVEVNATFYRTFKDDTYRSWKGRAPQGFGYVLKAPKLITHRKLLVDVEENIKEFYRSCSLLEDKFEMVLLQVAPNMPIDPARLRVALHAFPDPSRLAVEFRRAEWLTDSTLDLLREAGATICNVDSPQQNLTSYLTSERAYLRMHGRKHWYSYKYNPDELAEIAGIASQLRVEGAKKVYIFFNNDYNANAPADALAFRQLLESP